MKTFEDLFSELQHKAATRPEGSGTVEHESDEAACEEISQLLYHAQVMMVAKGYSLQDVYRYL